MNNFEMDPEFVEYLKAFKAEEKKSPVPGLLQNLEERSLGLPKNNVSSKEYRELIAEESLVKKEKFDELHCEMPGVPRSTFLMVFSPDGTKVASTHGNHNIYVTDIRSGKNLKTLVGHPRTPWCIAFHPTSNQIIASGCLGGQVRIWDLSGGSEVWTAKNQTVIASIAFHPIERILVVATSNDVYFWDWSKPDPFMQTSTGSLKEKVRYVAFDKLGQRLITGISNSHSRWDYVRSDRSSEPARHFNIASRRPVFRRGLLPARQSVPLSSANSDPPETRSRVAERDRNITMSYRNLVRQYGRLVQRYLQIYRPPAMIDRGTDPMENIVNNSSEEAGPSGSANNAIRNSSTENARPRVSADNAVPSCSSAGVRSRSFAKKSRSRGCSEKAGPSGSSTRAGPSNSAKKARASVSAVSKWPSGCAKNAGPSSSSTCAEPSKSEKMACPCNSSTRTIPNDTPSYPGPNVSAENVGTSGFAGNIGPVSTGGGQESGGPASSQNKYKNDRWPYSNILPRPAPSNRKHKNDSLPQNNIPQKRLKVNAVSSSESTTRSESPQPGPSGLSNSQNRTVDVRELARVSRAIITSLTSLSNTSSKPKTVKTSEGRSEKNQNSSAQTESFVPCDGENQQPIQNLEGPTTNPTENTTERNNPTNDGNNSIDQVSNGMTQNQQCNSQEHNNDGILEETSIPSTSRDDSAISTDSRVERIYNHLIRSLGNQPQEIIRSTPNQMLNVDSTQINQNITANSSESLQNSDQPVPNINELVTNSEVQLPGPSGVSDQHPQNGEERRLEELMMDMRGRAEDTLRARLLPLLSSGVPENSRNDLMRLIEAGIRESRERARARYRQMLQQMYNEQSNGEAFVPPPGFSSDDRRDPYQLILLAESRIGNTTNNGFNTVTGNTGSGYDSSENINNLESWVSSLFNDENADRLYNEIDGLLGGQQLADSPNPEAGDVNTSLNSTSSSSPESPQNASTPESSTNTITPSNPAARSQNQTDVRSAFTAARTETYNRSDYLSPRLRRQVEALGVRLPPNPVPDNNFARDEVINFSELPNSENPASDRSEDFHSNLQPPFHPFNPPPNLPAINQENIGIGNMYGNIIHELETNLNNVRNWRTLDRPGEMTNMLNSFSNRLQTLMNQSEDILRNLRSSVEVLPDSDTLEFGVEPPVPTASFNDSSFFVRDQGAEGSGTEQSSSGYEIPQNNATSDHTYPRNLESGSTSSNSEGNMTPLLNSIHLTLSHIQVQSRLLHRQVESIERIDRAMVEVSQIQMMRLLLGELNTYVRNMSGDSRSTGMTSVRQMMAGTRISESGPSNAENVGESTSNRRPSTHLNLRCANQNASARSRGLFRKTYPPSRLYRILPSAPERTSRDSSSSESTSLPTTAPPHTFSIITIPTLVRMERRLQAIIDDHARRFSYLTQLITSRSNNPRRLVHGLGEHNVALRLRECISRVNRLLGNIFNPSIIRNYRIDASTSLRHGINRYYERTFLSLIIDGLSSYLDENMDQSIPSEARTRMQSVLQLAMMMADLLLLYTLISLSLTSEVNLDSERRQLASRIEETCSTLIHSRRCSNIFVQSLRNLRLMVSVHCESPIANRASSSERRNDLRSAENARLWRSMRARYAAEAERDRRDHYADTVEEAFLYVARSLAERTRLHLNSRNTESNTHQNRRARYRVNNPRENRLFNAYVYLRRRQSLLNNTTNSETQQSQNDDDVNRRRNITDLVINPYLTARNAQVNQSTGNPTSETGSQPTTNRNLSFGSRRNRSGFNPYRDMDLITTRSTDTPADSAHFPGQSHDPYRTPVYRSRINSSEPAENTVNQNARAFGQSMREQEAASSSIDYRWNENTAEPYPTEPSDERESFFNSSNESRMYDASILSSTLAAPLSPIQSRPSTSNNTDTSPSRLWRIPAVQVNDVPVSDLVPPPENSDSESSSNTGTNSSNSAYPGVMARLAAFRSNMPLYNPMGVLRPRLLHPLYSALNPFDADLEQREHIYDNDVISTVTPNHRIQVWDISDSVIPKISDPLKNLVVRECKIHNDASVDIASDGSILVTLLPSGGYLNITNRLGIYSLRWETLGQCLYTTSFVHNAVSVSLSPLGRHLVVALASRRVSILPNDRWMMASIYRIEEKETRGDNLPFVRQIERGRNEPTSHKSVNCIRWLPTSGQGLIYATNTGQLNIWT